MKGHFNNVHREVQFVPGLFAENPTEARTALAMIADASDVLAILIEGGHSTIAGRLAGAFRNIGRERVAEQIVTTMKSADYDVRENNPFQQPAPFAITAREPSPAQLVQFTLDSYQRKTAVRP